MHPNTCHNSQLHSTAMLMDASIYDLAAQPPAKKERELMSNSSFGSTASSDFAFELCDQVLHDEPPASPKFADTDSYRNWQNAVLLGMETSMAMDNNCTLSTPIANCSDYNSSASHGADCINSDGLSQHLNNSEISNHSAAGIREADRTSATVVDSSERASIPTEDRLIKHRRIPLRSLMLERRDLQQLSPLFDESHHCPSSAKVGAADNHDDDQLKPNRSILGSSPSHSSSASSSSSSSSPELSQHSQKKEKKSRRWSFNLDFLKKPSPGKAQDPRLHQQQLHHGGSGDHLRQTNTHFTDRLHIPLRSGSNSAVPVGHQQYCLDGSIGFLNAAGPGTGCSNFESPRHSSCGSISTSITSSAVEQERGTIKGSHPGKGRCASAPVSPAASPSRSPAPRSPRYGSLAAPMSPHVHHYRQQRARAEELRKKTFLPYRQSLLGACFFHSTPQAQVC